MWVRRKGRGDTEEGKEREREGKSVLDKEEVIGREKERGRKKSKE